jgi:hypothetical protein
MLHFYSKKIKKKIHRFYFKKKKFSFSKKKKKKKKKKKFFLPSCFIIFVKGHYLRNLIKLGVYLTFFKELLKLLKIDSNTLVNNLDQKIRLVCGGLCDIYFDEGILFFCEFN